ncbi:heterokaryon incompatibility protein-domain-containing protein [Hypomontagnella monticulosa]|nr:heterokaryon incompatibility protein-domain-containing protein [Hypomontagnella monticulosa]
MNSPPPSYDLVNEVISRTRIRGTQDDSIPDEVNQWWEEDAAKLTKYPVDPHWIDLDIVRGWMDTCVSTHGFSCWPLNGLDCIPLWLIDVELLCLVPAFPHHRYLALSYVWGNVESSETTLANLEAMQLPGAMSHLNTDISIPKTISHAIGFVKAIGERFLWVDRFCICQDDEEAKSAQINNMGDIYNNALVTIVAASGWDANHGLRGIKGVTEPRNLSPNMGDDYVKSLQPQSSIWYSRGWTFQELCMSKRKLMFHYQAVIWECGSHVWHEAHGCQNTPEIPRPLRITPWSSNEILNTGALLRGHLKLYYRLVNSYNSRNLSYAADASRAFAGVASVLTKRVLPGGFIWGIPVDLFHAALLWIPREPMKRRYPERAAGLDPPSWSWLGWQGRIRDDNWLSFNYHGESDVWQTLISNLEPESEWWYMNRSNEMELEPLRPLDPQTNAALFSPCLTVRAQVGTLAVISGKPFINTSLESRVLRLPNRAQSISKCGILLGDVSETEIEEGTEIECMILSSSKGAIVPFLRYDEMFSFEKTYYNFLWIRREGDLAYRRGIGRVVKSLWDKYIGNDIQTIRLA